MTSPNLTPAPDDLRCGADGPSLSTAGAVELALAIRGRHLGTHATSARGRIARIRRKQLEAMADLSHVIYAVLTDDGLIKIGYSENLQNRLRFYGIGVKNMNRLLLVMSGARHEEQQLHDRFRRYRARGHEYYRPAPAIIDMINRERERLGVPPLVTTAPAAS